MPTSSVVMMYCDRAVRIKTENLRLEGIRRSVTTQTRDDGAGMGRACPVLRRVVVETGRPGNSTVDYSDLFQVY